MSAAAAAAECCDDAPDEVEESGDAFGLRGLSHFGQRNPSVTGAPHKTHFAVIRDLWTLSMLTRYIPPPQFR